MDDLRKRFGRLVAAHRRKRGMTQLQLAEAADISDAMIGRIERGATGARFPSIERLSKVLQVDPAELFMAEASPAGSMRKPLLDLTARLSALSDKDLKWVDELLDSALKARS